MGLALDGVSDLGLNLLCHREGNCDYATTSLYGYPFFAGWINSFGLYFFNEGQE
jgi:hypothetical protein